MLIRFYYDARSFLLTLEKNPPDEIETGNVPHALPFVFSSSNARNSSVSMEGYSNCARNFASFVAFDHHRADTLRSDASSFYSAKVPTKFRVVDTTCLLETTRSITRSCRSVERKRKQKQEDEEEEEEEQRNQVKQYLSRR